MSEEEKEFIKEMFEVMKKHGVVLVVKSWWDESDVDNEHEVFDKVFKGNNIEIDFEEFCEGIRLISPVKVSSSRE